MMKGYFPPKTFTSRHKLKEWRQFYSVRKFGDSQVIRQCIFMCYRESIWQSIQAQNNVSTIFVEGHRRLQRNARLLRKMRGFLSVAAYSINIPPNSEWKNHIVGPLMANYKVLSLFMVNWRKIFYIINTWPWPSESKKSKSGMDIREKN